MTLENAIKEKLTKAFAPAGLKVVNESHLHAGHASSPGTGESHFAVVVVADAFDGKSRVERHRMVNEALADELAGGIHALAIRAMTPAEHEDAKAAAES
ncbi:BolA family protein [Methyloligella solikamskensis]|uniref:BolA family protein n=1 Tax=Methyloligella solikamskensis TaxID=1177756 RepID=A0ABW3J7U9_9HYPH